MEVALYFGSASILLMVGHFLRVERWKLISKGYFQSRNSQLFLALTIGYISNLFLPFRVGELFRALALRAQNRANLPMIIATVIFERLTDIVFIAVVVTMIWWLTGSLGIPYVVLGISIILVFFSILVGIGQRQLKKVTYIFSSLFNTRIKLFIQNLHWSYSLILKQGGRLLIQPAYWLLSIGMWSSYILSVLQLQKSLSYGSPLLSAQSIFNSIYNDSIKKSAIEIISAQYDGLQFAIILAYFIVPLILITVYVLLTTGNELREFRLSNFLPFLNWHLASKHKKEIHIFAEETDQIIFLQQYFIEDPDGAEKLRLVTDNIQIVRNLTSGSNAHTWVIRANDGEKIRKIAFGKDGATLAKQVDWLSLHSTNLSCAPIIRHEQGPDFYAYEMPYRATSISFFDIIHSLPLDRSEAILLQILIALEKNIYATDTIASSEEIRSYLSQKVEKNLDEIKSGMPQSLLAGETITINSKKYRNISFFEKRRFVEVFAMGMTSHQTAPIHGDLTIENIIIQSDELGHGDRPGWYLIDPNPENIFNSPFIDYAKLFQSLNKGYELLLRTPKVKHDEGQISFISVQSSQYLHLSNLLVAHLGGEGSDRMRNARIHEIINYFRLIPYRQKKNSVQGIILYSTLIILLNEFWDRYSKEGTLDAV